MYGRLAALWQFVADYLKSALWFIPAVMTAAAIVLAYVTLSFGGIVDRQVQHKVWWLHSGSGRDASTLMGTLLSSMITVTTLVVSIMVVVLTLAAAQLGPRLIRSFVGDRRTQAALGIFIATIAYLLVILRTIEATMTVAEVPHVAVTTGSFLSLLCILVLLFFVHHLTRSIVADTVIDQVGREVEEAIRHRAKREEDAPQPADGPSDGAQVTLSGGGYVQVIDFDGLVRCAAKTGAVIVLDLRPGDHLLPNQPVLRVSPASALNKTLETAIRRSVILGRERTTPQDVQFGLRKLVEIGLRALSAGINDAYTAEAVIDRLALALALVMDLRPFEAVHRDDAGVARVYARPDAFEDLVGTAFDQLRQAATGKADILARLLSALCKLACHMRGDEHHRVLRLHADLVLAQARRSLAETHDLAAVERRYESVLVSLLKASAPAPAAPPPLPS